MGKSKYLSINNLKVSEELFSFVNDDLLNDSGITSEKFWSGFDKAIHELAPRNKELILTRENLQIMFIEKFVNRLEVKKAIRDKLSEVDLTGVDLDKYISELSKNFKIITGQVFN